MKQNTLRSDNHEIGLKFEREMFGKHPINRRKLEPLRLSSALRQAKRAQKRQFSWDPLCPSTRLGLCLFESVVKHLPEPYSGRLRFYAGVGLAIDVMGVDGFFTLEGVGTVTIDLTTAKKKKSIRADLLICKHELVTNWDIDQVGKKIAGKFKDKMRESTSRLKIHRFRRFLEL